MAQGWLRDAADLAERHDLSFYLCFVIMSIIGEVVTRQK